MGAHQLYASDVVKEQLSWIGERLPEVADADVIVVARDDIVAFVDGTSDVDMETTTNNFLGVLSEFGVAEDYITKLSGLSELPQGDMLALAVKAVVDQRPMGGGFDVDGDGKNDFGIITAPDFSMSNEDLIERLSKRQDGQIENVPEGHLEGLAAVMYHEAGHIHKMDARHEVLNEMYADLRSKMFFEQDVQAGRLNGDFLPAFEVARTAGSLGSNGGYLDSIGYRFKAERAEDISGTMGYMVMAERSLLPTHSTHAAFDDPILPTQTVDEITNSEFRGMLTANDMLQGIAGMMWMLDMVEENAGAEALSGDAADFFSDPMEMMDGFLDITVVQHIGTIYLQENPTRAYGAMKALEEAGLFEGEGFEGERQYIASLDSFFESYVVEDGRHDDFQNSFDQTAAFLDAQNIKQHLAEPRSTEPSELLRPALVNTFGSTP